MDANRQDRTAVVDAHTELVDWSSETLNEGRDSLGVFKSGTHWATIFPHALIRSAKDLMVLCSKRGGALGSGAG